MVTVYAQVQELAGDPRLPDALRPRTCLLALEVARLAGRNQDALLHAAMALEAAEQWGTWAEVGLARLEAGQLLARAQADEQAQVVLQLFLDHLERYPWLSPRRGEIQYELGLVLHRRRHYNGALNAFKRSLDFLDGEPRLLLAAHHQCCWLALKLGRFREAARYLASAGPPALESPEGSLIQQALQALYFLRTGDTGQAERLAAESGAAAQAAGSPRAMALAAYVQAEAAEVRRRTRVARRLRQEVQEQVQASGCPELATWLGANREGFSHRPGSREDRDEQCFDDPASWSL